MTVDTVPLAARVVEVIAYCGKDASPHRYCCGSGCLVGGPTVLTAAHVVTGVVSVVVRGPDKVEHDAALDPAFVGDTAGGGPDLALIEVTDSNDALLALTPAGDYDPGGEKRWAKGGVGWTQWGRLATRTGREPTLKI